MKVTKLKNSILFKNTFIYTLLQLINSGIPFLLLPILTRYLTPEDYGIIATYNTFVGVLSIFVGLSMSGAVGVSFFNLKQEELGKYIGNVFVILIISTFLITIVITVFQELIIQQLEIPIMWIYIAIAVALMRSITGINLVLWRSQQRAKPFAFYAISQTIFNISVSLLLVILLKYGWEGRTKGTASAAVIFGLLSILFINQRGYLVFKYSKKYLKDLLRFGIPLVPHSLASWMRVGVDVLLITSIVGITQTGIYTVGYQLGSVVGFVVHAFNNAYSPYLYKKLKTINNKGKLRIVKFTYLYFVVIILFAIGLSEMFTLILPNLLDEKFQKAEQYVIWIALAYAFNGMYLMVVNYIFYVKKTHFLSMVTISTSIIHVMLSYTFICEFGAIGAAYASLISFFTSFLIVWRVSARVFEMPWRCI